MSLQSAHSHMDALSDPHGYCLPLAVDSLLKHTDLPDRYYEIFKAAIDDPTANSNEPKNKLLRDFFKVTPQPDTEMTSVAQYNAYDASVQSYCPDVPYVYPKAENSYLIERGATAKQLRLRKLLIQTMQLDCLVIVQTRINDNTLHAQALDLFDKGGRNGRASYVVRNNSYLACDSIYGVDDFCGLNQNTGEPKISFAPLPEVARPYYPKNDTSWELIILPPEPR